MLACNIIAIALAVIALIFEFRRQLMMLQQNSYRNERYKRWLTASQDSTSVMRLVTGAVALAAMSTLTDLLVSLSLVTIVSVVNIFSLAGKKYKKPLVMTRRATRIFTTMSVLAAIVIGGTVTWCAVGGYPLDSAAVAALLVFCFSQSFTMLDRKSVV